MNIALIANENKKTLMQSLCIAYKGILSRHTLFATGTTGQLIEAATNMHVHKFHFGHLGGVKQMGTMITENDIDLVIFLRDVDAIMDPADIQMLVESCDLYNVPLATNLATAEVLVKALGRGDLDWRMYYK